MKELGRYYHAMVEPLAGQDFIKNMYFINRQNRRAIFLGENHPIFLGSVVRLSITLQTHGFYVSLSGTQKEIFMRGGYRGIPKPKLPSHLKRVHINARIQKWMLDELKKQGEVGIVLEYILEKNAGFKYQPKKKDKNCRF